MDQVQMLRNKFEKSVDDSASKNHISKEEAALLVLKELFKQIDWCEKEGLDNSALRETSIEEDETDDVGLEGLSSFIPAKNDLYSLLLDLLKSYQHCEELRNATLELLLQLIERNPNFLCSSALDVFTNLLASSYGTQTQILSLSLCIHCSNKQDLKKMLMCDSVLENIEDILKENELHKDILEKVCDLLKVISSSFVVVGHDQTFQMYRVLYHVWDDAITRLVYHLHAFKNNKCTLKKVLNTLSATTSRDSLCKSFSDAGGVKLISEILKQYSAEEEVIFNCFRLLKAVSHSDKVRDEAFSHVEPCIIMSAFQKYYHSEQTSRIILAALVTLTLRHGANGKRLVENGLIDTLKMCLSSHPESILHLRRGCWVIVNVVSRNKNYREMFLKSGISSIIRDMVSRMNSCQYECKAALTQLGFRIQHIDKLMKDVAIAHKISESEQSETDEGLTCNENDHTSQCTANEVQSCCQKNE